MMDERTRAIHLAAGEAFGRDNTCGRKVRHPTEERAISASRAMNRSPKSHHEVEPYPCFFCGEWHTGRAMTPAEYAQFGQVVDSVL